MAWWLADSLGAIPIAAGIALAVGVRTGSGLAPAWPALLLLAGGAWRALAVTRATMAGHTAAIAAGSRIRAAVHPALLASRTARASLVGEDMQLAVDSILAADAAAIRFLPLRAASAVSPLIVALAVAAASRVSSLILLATLVPFVFALILAGSAAARRAEMQHAALNRLAGLFVDRLRALPPILGLGAESRVSRHLGFAAGEVAARTMDVLAIAFASSAILEFFAALSVALVAVYCGFSLLGLLPFPAPEPMTAPRAFFTLALAPEFYLAMRRLAATYHDKQQADAATAAIAGELARILPMPEPVAAPSRWTGSGVIFAHREGARIGPLDWQGTHPGLHAVAGPTGAGKSTVLAGLVGQVPCTAGSIRADAAPFASGALNAAIGWAGQDIALFPGTLRENLALGAADDAAMVQCLETLGLGAMLVRRGGLGMAIDHRGAGLSGGERRRIGLARAILSDRPILLLDEPTADLDDHAAASIRAMLMALSTRRMVIVATHDAALVGMARTVLEIAA